jgi:hypothetical protein
MLSTMTSSQVDVIQFPTLMTIGMQNNIIMDLVCPA